MRAVAKAGTYRRQGKQIPILINQHGRAKMKPDLRMFVAALLFTLLLTGCVRRMIDFTVISSKNVRLDLPDDAVGPRTVGKHQTIWITFIPLGFPHIKEATDNAIEKAGPQYDALIDGVVYSYFYWFIFGVQGFKVEGTPVNTKMLANLPAGALDGRPILYHSSLGISNDEAIAALGIVDLGGSRQDSIRAALVEDRAAQQ